MLQRDDLGVFRCADLVNGADGIHVAADLLVGLLCHGDLERRYAGGVGTQEKAPSGQSSTLHSAVMPPPSQMWAGRPQMV